MCLQPYLKFEGKFYEQMRRTAIGLTISDFIEEAMMRRLVKIVRPIMKPKLLVLHADNTSVILKLSEIQATFAVINWVFTEIQFTMETKRDSILPFLGMLVTRTNIGTVDRL